MGKGHCVSVQTGRNALSAQPPSPADLVSSANAPMAPPKPNAATTVNANVLFIALTSRPLQSISLLLSHESSRLRDLRSDQIGVLGERNGVSHACDGKLQFAVE